MAPSQPSQLRKGCLLGVAIALAAILLAMVLGGRQVGKLWEFGKDIFALQQAVEEEFDLTEVGINWQSSNRQSTLEIELETDRFEDLSEDEREAFAMKVARFAKAQFTRWEPDSIKVTYAWKSGILKSTKDFRFDPDELEEAAPSPLP